MTLSNLGTSPLGISSISVTGNYMQVNTCGGLLSAQSICTIYLTPTASSTGSGALTISSTDTTDAQAVALATVYNGTLEDFGLAPYPYNGFSLSSGYDLGFTGQANAFDGNNGGIPIYSYYT